MSNNIQFALNIKWFSVLYYLIVVLVCFSFIAYMVPIINTEKENLIRFFGYNPKPVWINENVSLMIIGLNLMTFFCVLHHYTFTRFGMSNCPLHICELVGIAPILTTMFFVAGAMVFGPTLEVCGEGYPSLFIFLLGSFALSCFVYSSYFMLTIVFNCGVPRKLDSPICFNYFLACISGSLMNYVLIDFYYSFKFIPI